MRKSMYLALLSVLIATVVILSSYLVVAYWWYGKYDIDNFNCVDMSYVLAPIFNQFGFDTKIIYGCGNNGSNNRDCHCWLSLNGYYFESTGLYFRDQSEYKDVFFVDSYPFCYWDELGLDQKYPHLPLEVKG